jgi:hypothetical protein
LQHGAGKQHPSTLGRGRGSERRPSPLSHQKSLHNHHPKLVQEPFNFIHLKGCMAPVMAEWLDGTARSARFGDSCGIGWLEIYSTVCHTKIVMNLLPQLELHARMRERLDFVTKSGLGKANCLGML